MNFTYFIPTRIVFGSGALRRLHEQQLPGKRALVVTTNGTSVKKYGYLETLQNELKLSGVEYVLYDKILPNPVKEHVMEGAAVAKAQKADFIIGIGGGSAIDSAKAIAIMATNNGDYWDYISGGSGKDRPVLKDPLPVVAITTTAGTGTEADPWTVITKAETNEKIGGGYDKTFPVLSIVDPEIMRTVPPKLTAYQGFDALFHSTEGYLNKKASPISDLYALKAIEYIGKSLSKAVRDGNDLHAREEVALANTLSGMVESLSGCTSEHSLAHAISAYHPDFVHGAALLAISRAYYAHFASTGAVDMRMIQMAKALGAENASSPEDFVTALVKLQKDCGVDAIKMSEYGMREDTLAQYVYNARDTMGCLFAYDRVPLSDADALRILQNSYR